MINFILSSVEHETRFITSGPVLSNLRLFRCYVPISNGYFEKLLGTKLKYLFPVLLFETLKKASMNPPLKHILNSFDKRDLLDTQ